MPHGSILVIENLDRLSREGFGPALRKIIFRLWDHGIVLQTIDPEASYEAGCEDDPKFVGLWLYLSEAHKASVRKSNMVRSARTAAREKAREKGAILTARCPAWLMVKDGEFIEIPDAVTAVKAVFDMKLAGVGVNSIARRLNTERGWWKPAPSKRWKTGGWRASYIRKILTNEAVIGVYQPYTIVWRTVDGEQVGFREPIGNPIDGYYPAVVEAHVFHAVQEQLSANYRCTGGKTGKVSNLLRSLVVCPYCGGRMHFINKGQPPKGGSYLVCDAGRRGVKCSSHSIRYEEVERLVLENCRDLKPESVLPNPDEQNKLCQSLRQRIVGKEAQTRDIAQRIENFEDQIGRTDSRTRRDNYEARVKKLEQEQQSIERSLQQDRTELARAEQALQSFDRWQRDLQSLQKALADTEDVELRQRVHAHLRQLIDRIEVYSDGFAKEYDGDGHEDDERIKMLTRNYAKWKTLTPEQRSELRKPTARDCCETVGEYLYDLATEFDLMDTRTEDFGEFVRYVVKRRMSKAGRFVRVFFKTDTWADFVPPGSIASGRKLYVDKKTGRPGWEFITPDVGALWQEYKRSRGKAGRRVAPSIRL